MRQPITCAVLLLLAVSVAARANDFLARCRTAAAEANEQQLSVLAGQADWLFFVPELRHLGVGPFWGAAAQATGRATQPEARDPLPAILNFHESLAARKIQLILVPVPPKAVVHEKELFGAENLSPARPDTNHQAFYELLRAQGVTVLDLTDRFRTAWESPDDPPYCRQDTHWSPSACVVAAQEIAVLVAPLIGGAPTSPLEPAWQTLALSGDLRQMSAEPERPRETVRIRMVPGAVTDETSPVVLLGDSHVLVYHAGNDMFCREGGLPDQLAFELGRPVDLAGVRGSGATPARINLFRRAQRKPAYWDAKRVVVWVFAAREFTESDGWRQVPLAP